MKITNGAEDETSVSRFNKLEASMIAPCRQKAADNIQNLPVPAAFAVHGKNK